MKSDQQITGLKRELEYDDFPPLAKKGIKKFASLSSDEMDMIIEEWREKYPKKGINYKIAFYIWVLKKKI